jgi:hypothetical protein
MEYNTALGMHGGNYIRAMACGCDDKRHFMADDNIKVLFQALVRLVYGNHDAEFCGLLAL